jgi:hypothetical protein
MDKAIAAIDPSTKRCAAVSIDRPGEVVELWNQGFILVPVSIKTAQGIYATIIEDIASIAIK